MNKMRNLPIGVTLVAIAIGSAALPVRLHEGLNRDVVRDLVSG